MIKSLDIKGAPCFPREGLEIGTFEEINFFFGSNGSGKTTISRALGDVDRYTGTSIGWEDPRSEPKVKVYNRDYVQDTFGSAHLPGVFLLGSESKEARGQIDRLTGKDGEITKAKEKLAGLEKHRSDKEEALAIARNKLTESSWKKKGQIPDALSRMFQGVNNSKEKFTEKVLESGTRSPAPTDLDDLIKGSKSAFDESARPIEELKPVTFLDLSVHQGAELLGEKLVGSKDVTLSQLIEDLGNSDWVARGQAFLKRKPEVCPFCQQPVSSDLLGHLAEYFDVRFSEQTRVLGDFVRLYREAAEDLLGHLDGLLESDPEYLDAGKLKADRSALDAANTKNVKSLEKKQEKPSTVIEMEDLTSLVDTVNQTIEETNAEIRRHNSGVRNRATAKKELVERCWDYFRTKVVGNEIGRFDSASETLKKAIDGLDAKIVSETDKVRVLEKELREYEKQVVTSKQTIEEINALLEAVGFSNFRLGESEELEDGYQLVRPDGTTEYDTLSEGERTFITFLYFFHELQGRPNEGDGHLDLVAVIDDPISSLDSDIMFVISQLLMRLMRDVQEKNGRVRQLVLLTHNAYFHKEVTFERHGDKSAGRKFFVVRKTSDNLSVVESSDDNPIMTSYSRLWDEIRRAQADTGVAPVGLQNAMRRILETYFRILGGTSYDFVLEKFSGAELTVCRSLFSWVNEGSHSIVEEIDYSPSENSIELYLRVFRKIFDAAGHEGHYAMMMREQDPIALVV